MKVHRLAIPLSVTAMFGVWTAVAQETNTLELIRQLHQRIEELEHKVQTLETTKSAAANTNAPQPNEALETAKAKTKETPKLSLGEQGFSFASANGDFAVQLKGVLQIDSRTFFNDGGTVGNDGFLLRRARPILQGTLFKDFDFLFIPDFGTGSNGGNGGTTPTPQIFDAYLNYRYSAALQFQAGKFKSPIGLEQLAADRDLLFNERALPTDLVPNRDIGFELHGDLFDGVASYAAGIFTGVGDARNSSNSDFEDDKAFEGRLFLQPFKRTSARALQGFGFGVGGGFESLQGNNTAGLPATTGGSLAGFATVVQQQFFAYNPTFGSVGTNKPVVVASGDHWRLSPQGHYYFGPFGLFGEYVVSDQVVRRTMAAPITSAHLANTAWQVAGSWVLTGEEAGFGTLVPRRPFSPAKGDWGAWQLVARFSELDIDSDAFPLYADPATSARSAKEWSVGLNWYLNRNVRVSTSFSHTSFEGGGGFGTSAPAAVTRKDENVLFTRVQLAF